MTLDRRDFLTVTGLAATAGVLSACGAQEPGSPERPADPPAGPSSDEPEQRADGLSSGDDWDEVRNLFSLEPGLIDLSAMVITSHPRPVAEAIANYRDALDANPAGYLDSNNTRLTEAAREAAGSYLGTSAAQIALTASTTMGVGLVYGALPLQEGEEILTTEQDYFVTHEAIRLACRRSGARQVRVQLYEDIARSDPDAMIQRIVDGITYRTRVLGLTWVHSSTGLKIPLREIMQAVEAVNAEREPDDRIVTCVDGVHAFGVEDFTFEELGCDFFMTGCHKWLFGPRGTGIIAGRGFARLQPSIPSFIDDSVFNAWLGKQEPDADTTAARLTPGGHTAFEHRWALPEAFALHLDIGKARIAERTHELASQLKEGLDAMDHIALLTPKSPDRSAGIVAFDVNAYSPANTVARLREQNIIASVAPSARPHVLLTPCVRNTPAEIDTVLSALSELSD